MRRESYLGIRANGIKRESRRKLGAVQGHKRLSAIRRRTWKTKVRPPGHTEDDAGHRYPLMHTRSNLGVPPGQRSPGSARRTAQTTTQRLLGSSARASQYTGLPVQNAKAESAHAPETGTQARQPKSTSRPPTTSTPGPGPFPTYEVGRWGTEVVENEGPKVTHKNGPSNLRHSVGLGRPSPFTTRRRDQVVFSAVGPRGWRGTGRCWSTKPGNLQTAPGSAAMITPSQICTPNLQRQQETHRPRSHRDSRHQCRRPLGTLPRTRAAESQPSRRSPKLRRQGTI